MALTAKQERFCLEYVVDYNGTQAAIRAGYSEHTARSIASENLTKPDIVERVTALSNATADELGITRRRILEKLWAAVEVNFPAYEIVEDRKGRPVAITLGNPSASNKALELLMKHRGDLVEKVHHEGGISIEVNGIDASTLK